MERVLARRELTARETALWLLVEAMHLHTIEVRKQRVEAAAKVLSADEVFHANSVIALFNLYNKLVDLNGVDELTAAGYAASGERLSTQGYAPPTARPRDGGK